MSEEDWEYLLNQMDDNSDWLLIGEWERFGLVWEWATKQEWWEGRSVGPRLIRLPN
jgi:hypothetical protein